LLGDALGRAVTPVTKQAQTAEYTAHFRMKHKIAWWTHVSRVYSDTQLHLCLQTICTLLC